MSTELARFGSALAIPAVTGLWLAALIRGPSVVNSRQQRGLWLAVVSAAAAMTLDLPAVVNFVVRDGASGHAVSLTRNCIGVVSAGAVLYFVASTTGRHRLRIMAVAAAVVYPGLLVALDGMTPPHGQHVLLAHGRSSPGILYWLALITAHLLADSVCTFVCWRYARQAGRTLSASLLVFGAGTAFAGLFWLVLLTEVVLDNRWGSAFSPLLMSLHGLLRAAALLVPSFASLLRTGQDCVVAWRLWPLWHELVKAVPNVALSTPQGRLEELIRPAVPRSLLVYRRVIEIRDAMLVLGDYAGYCDPSELRTGSPVDRDSPTVEQQASALANLIRDACQAKVNRKPLLRNSFRLGTLGSCDLDEEKRFLLEVAHAYAKFPAHTNPGVRIRTSGAGGPHD
ncbi:MAB_1171c family putative transporter [Streptomyces sp. MMG1533]|uniref:MAB_1171c family putative transporter n=1 Tax=Streptomyces sp. MMG1533 TaxID=1415546 RepID=UPI000B1F7EAA|nr:MAB_1171c family putative transporter [Streptomyces sp. MMG1533]